MLKCLVWTAYQHTKCWRVIMLHSTALRMNHIVCLYHKLYILLMILIISAVFRGTTHITFLISLARDSNSSGQ